jgi:hypothetical protein
MISKEILKKHNLKAVPFSCVREGETFHVEPIVRDKMIAKESYSHLLRRKTGNRVDFFDGEASVVPAILLTGKTVYVPVWRPNKDASLSGRNKRIMNSWGYEPIRL